MPIDESHLVVSSMMVTELTPNKIWLKKLLEYMRYFKPFLFQFGGDSLVQHRGKQS